MWPQFDGQKIALARSIMEHSEEAGINIGKKVLVARAIFVVPYYFRRLLLIDCAWQNDDKDHYHAQQNDDEDHSHTRQNDDEDLKIRFPRL